MRKLLFVSALAAVLAIGTIAQAQPPGGFGGGGFGGFGGFGGGPGGQGQAATTITVDADDVKQTIDGFGVSEAFRQADSLRKFYGLRAQNEILDLLFDVEKGIGLSIVRSCIGSGGTWGHELDGPDGTIWPEPDQWDWDSDLYQVWFAQEAQKRGVDIFTAACWSPPYWMKQNNDVLPGHVKPENYDEMAQYFAAYVKGFEEKFGIKTHSVSISNEPNARVMYSGTDWTGEEMTTFVRDHLGPEFEKQDVDALIAVAEPANYGLGLAEDVLADPEAEKYVGLITVHTYGTRPDRKLDTKGNPLWLTEISNLNADDRTIADGISWASMIHEFFTKADGNAFFYWWGFCFKDGENHPNSGESLIYIHPDRAPSYSVTKRLYTMGQYSRFIRPGWQRIGCSEDSVDSTLISAYKSPDEDAIAIVLVGGSGGEGGGGGRRFGGGASIALNLEGIDVDEFEMYVTDGMSNMAKRDNVIVTDGVANVRVPGNGVVTLYSAK